MRGGDFGASMGALVRFSLSMQLRRVIFATGVGRGSHRTHPTGRRLSPTALCGRSAEISGDDLRVVAVDAGGRQMQHDVAHRHPGSRNRSRACSRIASPSALKCCGSNFAAIGRPHKSENRTLCRVLSSVTQKPLEW